MFCWLFWSVSLQTIVGEIWAAGDSFEIISLAVPFGISKGRSLKEIDP